MKSFFTNLAALFIFLGLWELISHSGIIQPQVFLPPISEIIFTGMHSILQGDLLYHIWATLYRALAGLFIATALAVPIGIGMGHYRKVHDMSKILVELLRPLPPIALIPVGILFLGLFDQMKISIIAFGCFWPILVNTITGVQQINTDLIDTARVFHINKWQILYEIVFRSSLHYILAGVRIALSIALIVSVAVDMLVGSNGIGFFIIDAERSFKFKEMYAGLIILAIVGFLLNQTLEYVHKKSVGQRSKRVSDK